MHKISQRSLASLVCPSAPFLAPRLVRAPILIAATTPTCSPPCLHLQRPAYATKSKGKGLAHRSRPARDMGNSRDIQTDNTTSMLTKFRQACEMRNVQKLMDLYPTLLEAGVLTNLDTRRISQALHVFIRNIRAESKRSEVFPFVQQIVAHLRNGKLEPHPYAFVHLFGIYKDCKRFDEGHKLWQWLVERDQRFVSQAAYGAAIELMAYGGIMTLPELEELYADAIKRFPGTFAEYHLSSDAIVPDRTQPIAITGIPMMLLQGILTARILARDWRKAYLALDTALRLYPTQVPSRYFELFMTERPVAEAYTAYLVACRAGMSMRPTHITALTTKIRAAIAATHSMSDRILLVKAIANALYAHVEAGGRLESIHVGAFIRAFEQLLPEMVAGQNYQGEAADLRDAIVLAAHEIISGLIQAGMAPQIHPFEALISLAGKLRVPGLLTSTLQDLKIVDIDLGPVALRSAINSAGLVGNKDLVEQLWERVVSAAEAERAQIPFEDWITFTRACRRADHRDYFRTQVSELAHAITASIERQLMQQIDIRDSVPDGALFEYMTPADLSTQLEILKSQMRNVEAVIMSGEPLDFSQSPFYMHLDPDYPSLGSVDDLRAVYDELTTDPHQPPPLSSPEGAPSKVVSSSTGLTLDELRFQNWISVLEMMTEAEAYESDLQIALDVAIKSGKPLKGAPETLRLHKRLHDGPHSITSLRLYVKSLRAPNPEDASILRKVESEVLQEQYKPMAFEAAEDKGLTRKSTTHATLTNRDRATQNGLPYVAARTIKFRPSRSADEAAAQAPTSAMPGHVASP